MSALNNDHNNPLEDDLCRFAFFRSAVPTGITDESGKILLVNNAYCSMVGYGREELIGRSFADFLPKDDREQALSRFTEIVGNSNVLEPLPQKLYRKDGGIIRTLTHLVRIVAEDGKMYLMGTMLDQTRELEQNREVERLLRVLDRSDEEIYMLDAQSLRIIYANNCAVRNTGYLREELEEKTPTDILSGYTITAFLELTAALWDKQKDCLTLEALQKKRSGATYPVRIELRLFENEDPPLFLLTATNLTESKQRERQLYYSSSYDVLTGALYRNAFEQAAEEVLPKAKADNTQLVLLFLDIVGFKKINERLGRDRGDKLLRAVSSRLRLLIPQGSLLGRYGGDQFIVLAPAPEGMVSASTLGATMVEAFSSPFAVGDQELFVQCAVGASLFPDDAEQMGDLVAHAELSASKAHSETSSAIMFYSRELYTKNTQFLKIEQDLRFAVVRNELFLLFQPQVCCKNGRVCGMEALVRWKRGSEIIPPGQFIPVAEETGLIVPIGKWILETACASYMEQRRNGMPDIIMAVNISSIQFRQPDFVEHLVSMLARTGMPPHRLELEITESHILQNTEFVKERITQLKKMNLRISVDDFGTGYSSLQYLMELPFDTLKIDKYFVDSILTRKKSEAVAATIVALSHNLGCTVVAEGVEQQEQANFLHKLACDKIQGYLFYRPMPIEQASQAANSAEHKFE